MGVRWFKTGSRNQNFFLFGDFSRPCNYPNRAVQMHLGAGGREDHSPKSGAVLARFHFPPQSGCDSDLVVCISLSFFSQLML